MPNDTVLLVVAFVVAVGVVVALATVVLRRRAPQVPVEDRDPWAEAAPHPEPPRGEQPDAARAVAPEPGPPAPPRPSGVLDRDALARRSRSFDAAGWDDRPDGFEGTDMGLVGGTDTGTAGAPPPRGDVVDASFIESLRARKDDA